MERKVLLTECMNRRVLALLEDEKVTEFHFGSSGEKKSCRLGEIYVGKVRKILPNIGGAFVEIANGERWMENIPRFSPIRSERSHL